MMVRENAFNRPRFDGGTDGSYVRNGRLLVLIRYFLERGSFVFSKFGVVSLLCWGRGRD